MLMRRLAHDIAKDLAAFSGAERAWNRLGLGWMAEVRGEFLVRENSADTIEEQASAPAPPRQVKITPVIDKLCPASAAASIDCWAVAVVNQIVVVGGGLSRKVCSRLSRLPVYSITCRPLGMSSQANTPYLWIGDLPIRRP
jgi:hypothetical protein